MSSARNTVYVVHCIDTEGPLYESLQAKFQRLRELFGIELAATEENLEKIRSKQLDLNGLEDIVATTFSSHLSSYKDTWDKLDEMLSRIMAEEFRLRRKRSRPCVMQDDGRLVRLGLARGQQRRSGQVAQ